MRIALRSAYATRRGAFLAVNGYCMTVGMPPKPSQTFIIIKDSALKLSIGAKPSIHTALAPEALCHDKGLGRLGGHSYGKTVPLHSPNVSSTRPLRSA